MATSSKSYLEPVSKEEHEKLLKAKRGYRIATPDDLDPASTTAFEKKWYKWWSQQEEKYYELGRLVETDIRRIWSRIDALEGKTVDPDDASGDSLTRDNVTGVPMGEGTKEECYKLLDKLREDRGSKKETAAATLLDVSVRLEHCDESYATFDCEAYEAMFLKKMDKKGTNMSDSGAIMGIGREEIDAAIEAQETELKEWMELNSEAEDEEQTCTHEEKCLECAAEALAVINRCNCALEYLSALPSSRLGDRQDTSDNAEEHPREVGATSTSDDPFDLVGSRIQECIDSARHEHALWLFETHARLEVLEDGFFGPDYVVDSLKDYDTHLVMVVAEQADAQDE